MAVPVRLVPVFQTVFGHLWLQGLNQKKASIKVFINENLQIKDQPRIIKFVDDIKIALTGKLGCGT